MIRLTVGATLLLFASASSPLRTQTATTPADAQPARLAPFKERLAAAQTVKVKTSVLGIQLETSLDMVHEKLDPLCDAAHPPKKEEEKPGDEGESQKKVLWTLAKTDYASIFIKADEKGRVTYILANLRPGKEIPFSKIGEVEKAPVQNDRTVAWDVVRPNRPLTRVVAQGDASKASSITIFIVKRSQK
jgi:hypothetical protein